MLDCAEIPTQENMVMLKECPINATPWLSGIENNWVLSHTAGAFSILHSSPLSQNTKLLTPRDTSTFLFIKSNSFWL